jgi:8-oxo-dGTP diphosphatase / 2-hydroxy-dATP diphosphatase
MKKVLTLCLVYQHPRILLGMKKRGFGQSRWNGFGGKVQENESVEEAAIRETREEASIEVTHLEKTAVIILEGQDQSATLEVHVFKILSFTGTPVETEEMLPRWFEIDSIPYSEMWPDDQYWFPRFFEGKKFTAKFLFEGQNKILSQEITEVDTL